MYSYLFDSDIQQLLVPRWQMNLPHRGKGAMFLGYLKRTTSLQITITIKHHSQLIPALWWLLHETALLLGTKGG